MRMIFNVTEMCIVKEISKAIFIKHHESANKRPGVEAINVKLQISVKVPEVRSIQDLIQTPVLVDVVFLHKPHCCNEILLHKYVFILGEIRCFRVK